MDLGLAEKKRRPRCIYTSSSKRLAKTAASLLFGSHLSPPSDPKSQVAGATDDLLTRVTLYMHGAQAFQSQDPFALLNIIEDPKEPLILLDRSMDKRVSTGGHLAVSGDIFDRHNSWG